MVGVRILLASFVLLSTSSYGKRKEIREVFTNDKEMKTINLSLGGSTILSFTDKPIKGTPGITG